jgi:RNA polymerase sigma-70 factor (ECF subfamily)
LTSRRRISEQTAQEVAELYRVEASGLFGQAMVLSQGDHASAEDLVQRVFEAAALGWRAVRPLTTEERRRWLYVVLKRRAIDTWRSERRILLDSDLLDNFSKNDVTDEVGEVVTEALSIDQLWKELRSLPPVRYRVAYLSWRCGWTAKEVAEALGMSPSTVRVHKHKAILHLRRTALIPERRFEREANCNVEQQSDSAGEVQS